MPPGLLALAAAVTLVIVGVLLLVDTITVRTGLGVGWFALAAFCASTVPLPRRP